MLPVPSGLHGYQNVMAWSPMYGFFAWQGQPSPVGSFSFLTMTNEMEMGKKRQLKTWGGGEAQKSRGGNSKLCIGTRGELSLSAQGERNVLEGGEPWKSGFILGQWGAPGRVRSRCPWLWQSPPGEGTGKGGPEERGRGCRRAGAQTKR